MAKSKDSPAAVSGGPSKAQEEKWLAESDLRTLIEAEAIKKDKKRFAMAQKCGREQAAALRKVAGNG